MTISGQEATAIKATLQDITNAIVNPEIREEIFEI